MKSVGLLTTHNLLLKEPLAGAGYALSEYTFPISQADLVKLHAGACRHVLLETDESLLEDIRPVLSGFAPQQSIICLGDSSNSSLREFLLAEGVSDFLPGGDPRRIVSYLNALQRLPKHGSEKVLVLDQPGPSRRIITNILFRFGYKSILTETIEEMFQALPGSLQMVIVNMGIEKLDLGQLIRRAYGMQELKGVPFLVFKDMRKGLFVHELISGLNRIAKFVLSPEELYSLLIDLFFRKDVMPLIARLQKSTQCDDEPAVWRGTLSQVFHQRAEGLLTRDNLFAEDSYRVMAEDADAIKKSLLKIDGLRWLRRDYAASTPIYGAGGSD